MLRQILVVTDATGSADPRVRAACDLAQRHGAHLTGVFLTSEYLSQYMAAESLAGLPADVVQKILTEHSKAVGEAAEKARLAFEAQAANFRISSDWLPLSGDGSRALMAAARRADLTIMGRVAQASLSEHNTPAATIAMGCGGPVLVTPEERFEPCLGRRVLVAWNGGREAARALRDAWPLIAHADEVKVLVVSPDGEGGPDGMLQRLIERHGYRADLILDRSADVDAESVILRQVGLQRADLLVMGLYGRPRLQELILGGVSRRMMSEAPIPILVAH
ncbi:universal stress protein [Phenylobacterium sp.]|uniref:universal stress protein n=1 Tax=Phenylobacterium sp. TaxID=1871053 RepID=UPI002FD9A037